MLLYIGSCSLILIAQAILPPSFFSLSLLALLLLPLFPFTSSPFLFVGFYHPLPCHQSFSLPGSLSLHSFSSPILCLLPNPSLLSLLYHLIIIHSPQNYNPNTQQAYQNSASFVPKLATKVLGWLNVQKDDLVLDLGCGGELLVCFLFCFWAFVGGEGA